MCKLMQGVTCVLHRTGQWGIHGSCPMLAGGSGNHTIAGLGRTGTCFPCGDKGQGQGGGHVSEVLSGLASSLSVVHCPHLSSRQGSLSPSQAADLETGQ